MEWSYPQYYENKEQCVNLEQLTEREGFLPENWLREQNGELKSRICAFMF